MFNNQIFLLIALGILSGFIGLPEVYAFSSGGCEGDCKKCHSLTNDEALGILKKVKAVNAKVVSIQNSPAPGLWEVAIEDQGKKGVIYVDFSKKYLLPGPIIEISTGTNKTLEKFGVPKEHKDVDFSKIPLNEAIVMGDPKAAKKVAVFTDPG